MATFTERVLILCKTYPSPSAGYTETSCVAGITEVGKLIRLFPVPFRLIADEQQFKKWQWITALIEKAPADHRPESHRIYVDKIQIDAEPLKAGKDGWPRRMELLNKIPIYTDFEAIEIDRQKLGNTLAILRPHRILELEIKATKNPTWTAEELAKLQQMREQASLFDVDGQQNSTQLLEKIPFDFYYHYECLVNGDPIIRKHKLVDWELGALYRRLRKERGPSGWEAPFRAKYEQELPSRDVHLLLGTMHRFKDQWLAVSVLYPPKPQLETPDQPALF